VGRGGGGHAGWGDAGTRPAALVQCARVWMGVVAALTGGLRGAEPARTEHAFEGGHGECGVGEVARKGRRVPTQLVGVCGGGVGEGGHVGQRGEQRVIEQRRAPRHRLRQEDHPEEHEPEAAIDEPLAGHAAEVETRGALSAAGGGVEADGVAVDAGAPVAHGDVEGSLVRAVEHQQEGGPVAVPRGGHHKLPVHWELGDHGQQLLEVGK
jgi:hypothetical protein